MSLPSFFSRHFHFLIPRLVTITLVTVACSSLAFCDQIHRAVHTAAANGDLATVQTLLKEDPDLVFSKDSNGWTPLHFAAFNGHKDVVELLLASRADVNATDNKGYTPLHWVAERGREDVVEFLRQHGGNDFSGDIHRAAMVGDLRAVRTLLAVNPDLVFNKVDHGKTPLHDAAYGGRKEVADFLLANKAEVDAKDIIGQTPLHWAVEHSDGSPSYKATAESLLANKAEVNARDALGRTPLHYAFGLECCSTGVGIG